MLRHVLLTCLSAVATGAQTLPVVQAPAAALVQRHDVVCLCARGGVADFADGVASQDQQSPSLVLCPVVRTRNAWRCARAPPEMSVLLTVTPFRYQIRAQWMGARVCG